MVAMFVSICYVHIFFSSSSSFLSLQVPIESWSLKSSDKRVHEPLKRARLGTAIYEG